MDAQSADMLIQYLHEIAKFLDNYSRALVAQDGEAFLEFGRIGRSSNESTTLAGLQSGRPFFSRRVGLSATGQPVDLEIGRAHV